MLAKASTLDGREIKRTLKLLFFSVLLRESMKRSLAEATVFAP